MSDSPWTEGWPKKLPVVAGKRGTGVDEVEVVPFSDAEKLRTALQGNHRFKLRPRS